MNVLPREKRIRVLAALVEGNSVRATCRMTGAAKGTVLKLLADAGRACSTFHDREVQDLESKRVQCDEIWSFVGCKEKAKKQGAQGDGDVWTWTAIDADSKLAVAWRVGDRDGSDAEAFMRDVGGRLKHRVQLTTDGHAAYLEAIEHVFGANVDYAMLVKQYREAKDGQGAERKYSPGHCTGAIKTPVQGKPDEAHISTSYVERQNLTMRMSMRRFTRLTNAFSKKVENLGHAVALHFVYYNYCRVHQTLRVTPAMTAGLTDRVWTIGELVDLTAQKPVAATATTT